MSVLCPLQLAIEDRPCRGGREQTPRMAAAASPSLSASEPERRRSSPATARASARKTPAKQLPGTPAASTPGRTRAADRLGAAAVKGSLNPGVECIPPCAETWEHRRNRKGSHEDSHAFFAWHRSRTRRARRRGHRSRGHRREGARVPRHRVRDQPPRPDRGQPERPQRTLRCSGRRGCGTF